VAEVSVIAALHAPPLQDSQRLLHAIPHTLAHPACPLSQPEHASRTVLWALWVTAAAAAAGWQALQAGKDKG